MWNYVVINSGEEYGDFLTHSAKGTTWGKHKYIKKESKGGKNRYYYAEQGKTPNVSSDRKKELSDKTVDKAQYEMFDARYKYQIAAEKENGSKAHMDPDTVDPKTLSGESLKAYNDYQNKKKSYQKANDASRSDMITPEEYIKKMKLRRNAKQGVHE